ncbi:MAG: urease accessory protein UreE [Ferruginibacter sp.]
MEWYETNKRILHKKTAAGRDVTMKFLKENQQLTQGDIVFEDEYTIIAIEIIACDVIVIRPKTMFDMASICYEIGNKHLPLFLKMMKYWLLMKRRCLNYCIQVAMM